MKNNKAADRSVISGLDATGFQWCRSKHDN